MLRKSLKSFFFFFWEDFFFEKFRKSINIVFAVKKLIAVTFILDTFYGEMHSMKHLIHYYRIPIHLLLRKKINVLAVLFQERITSANYDVTKHLTFICRLNI